MEDARNAVLSSQEPGISGNVLVWMGAIPEPRGIAISIKLKRCVCRVVVRPTSPLNTWVIPMLVSSITLAKWYVGYPSPLIKMKSSNSLSRLLKFPGPRKPLA